MPKTDKLKVPKEFIIDLVRDLFITKEDAFLLWEHIFKSVVKKLVEEDKGINLFNLVYIEKDIRQEKFIPNSFGQKDMHIPEKVILKCRIHPKLERYFSKYSSEKK